MGKHKDFNGFGKGQNVMKDDWVEATPKLQLLWDFLGVQYESKVVQGKSSGEPETGWWAAKTEGWPALSDPTDESNVLDEQIQSKEVPLCSFHNLRICC